MRENNRDKIQKNVQDNIVDILLTFSFISRLPIKLKDLPDWKERTKKIPAYFPLVGYVPGFIYALGSFLTLRLGIIAPVLSLIFGFYYFDLFHFDGLLDTLDGFLNQSSKEKRLEIMSKGNVGPFAVFYGVLYVIIFWELFNQIPFYYLLFGSVFGRYAMDVVLLFSKPAKSQGLGAILFPFEKSLLIPATVLTTPLAFLGIKEYITSLTLSWITGFIISKISERQIGGITGDVLGGSCLLTQLAILLTIGYVVNYVR
ncbi:MAG: adenosylcobinamide-GDP ribazoletransferase [Fervidobacterium sp.]